MKKEITVEDIKNLWSAYNYWQSGSQSTYTLHHDWIRSDLFLSTKSRSQVAQFSYTDLELWASALAYLIHVEGINGALKVCDMPDNHRAIVKESILIARQHRDNIFKEDHGE